MLEDAEVTHLRNIPLRKRERNRLRVARALARLTQDQLEERTGVLQAQISALELGHYRRVTIDTGGRLAKFFGCAIEDLFPLEKGPARARAAKRRVS